MAQLARNSLESYSREELLEFALTIRLSLRECQKKLRAALKHTPSSDTPASAQSPPTGSEPRSR